MTPDLVILVVNPGEPQDDACAESETATVMHDNMPSGVIAPAAGCARLKRRGRLLPQCRISAAYVSRS